MSNSASRIFSLIGGLFGAAGVIFYAAAAHLPDGYYASLAPILLGHATLLVMLGIIKTESMFPRIAGVLIVLGVLLFSSDLIIRQTTGYRIFPYAAPIGGTTIILGWLIIAIPAFMPSNTPTRDEKRD